MVNSIGPVNNSGMDVQIPKFTLDTDVSKFRALSDVKGDVFVHVDDGVKNLEFPKNLGALPWDNLAEARKTYENALKSGSLDNILEASGKLTTAQNALIPDAKSFKKLSPGPMSLWGIIKSHPWVTGAVLLVAGAGAYLAIRKDKPVTEEIV